MAKFGMRRPRVRRNNVQLDEPDVLELLMKHINNEETDDRLLNLSYELYGADAQYFKLGYNGKTLVFEVLTDEDDGYRSHFGGLAKVIDDRLTTLKFSPTPLAIINVKQLGSYNTHDYFVGWTVVSVHNNHEWMKFGTDNADDYYPNCVFEYSPSEQEVIDLDSKEAYINHVRHLLGSVREAIDTGLSELETLRNRYSRASAESIAKFFRENGLGDFAVEVEEIIEIAESE